MQEILQTTADTYSEILKSSKKVSKAPKHFFKVIQRAIHSVVRVKFLMSWQVQS